ncbi:ATP-binding cassette domain-containing protein [Clostridium sp.]|jgi:ABC-type nitrate/sulfonate/bicarbonate transport system ATPase subunit|uniref:ATP-binding cassette domain-containing protein n=1 Tax=Clostridium sp. TaxID=1506 RepID=UPI003EEFE473
MIKINNLKVSYENMNTQTLVIDNANLSVKKGEICALIGPSGGGKSTLLKVLAGIIVDYDGEVLIDGKTVDPKIHRIGLIPQNYGLVKWKTVEENIFLSAKIKDGKKNIDIDFYKKLLKELSLVELVKRYPNELSGGQMQRVSMARALLLKPELLLMDESFSALDAMTREEVQKLFLEVWEEHKVTTILVTHDIKEAIYLAQDIAIISSTPGEILEVIRNPLFGTENNSVDLEYIHMNSKLRGILKGDRKNET